MALKLIVDKLDDVAESVRGEYEEKDGKFHLKVEDLDTVTNDAVTAATRKANKEAEAERKKRQAWEKLGKTPEEIQALLDAQAEAERKAAEASGDHAKILKQHQDAWTKREKELSDELSASRNSEMAILRTERVLGALTKANVTEEGAELLPDRLAHRIKFETVNGKRVLKIVQADGESPMAGTGPDGTATIEDLVKEAATKYPSLFKSNNSGGGGKPPGTPPGGPGSIAKKSEFKSGKERAAWVEKNGLAAYNALPA